MSEFEGIDYLDEDNPNENIITMFPRSLRITNGWFFPGNNCDENAVYWDYYFDANGHVELCLDGGNGLLTFPISERVW